jgi:hypothetical protein
VVGSACPKAAETSSRDAPAFNGIDGCHRVSSGDTSSPIFAGLGARHRHISMLRSGQVTTKSIRGRYGSRYSRGPVSLSISKNSFWNGRY